MREIVTVPDDLQFAVEVCGFCDGRETIPGRLLRDFFGAGSDA
jgi:hypothetical protein